MEQDRTSTVQFITQNWRGKPLVSFEVIVSLIAATTTANGLRVHSPLDTHTYPPGLKVSDKDFAPVQLRGDKFHGEWNYDVLGSPLPLQEGCRPLCIPCERARTGCAICTTEDFRLWKSAEIGRHGELFTQKT